MKRFKINMELAASIFWLSVGFILLFFTNHLAVAFVFIYYGVLFMTEFLKSRKRNKKLIKEQPAA